MCHNKPYYKEVWSQYYSVKNQEKYSQVWCASYFWGLMVISDVYKSFIPNKTIFIKYCLTQWISKFPGSFEIHWVRQYLVNFMGLVGIVNTIVYKTMSNFHKSQAWQIDPISNIAIHHPNLLDVEAIHL